MEGATEPSNAGGTWGSGSEAGSYLRLIDSCITRLKADGPFRTCTESAEEEASEHAHLAVHEVRGSREIFKSHFTLRSMLTVAMFARQRMDIKE